MHNWWIATFEHLGLLTRDEAEHLSNNIRLGIHPENYKDAYNSLGAILSESPTRSLVVSRLLLDVDKVKKEVESITARAAQAKKAVPVTTPTPAPVVAPQPEPTPVVETPPVVEPVVETGSIPMVSSIQVSTPTSVSAPKAPTTDENKSVANATEA